MIRKALIAACLPLAACATALSDPAGTVANSTSQLGPEDGTYPSLVRMGSEIINNQGNVIGALELLEGPNGVLVEVTIGAGGLTPGWHGLHLHQVGDCSDISEFKLSGGHLGMLPGGHGLANPKGPEAGDLPNIWAGSDGAAGYETFSDMFDFETLLDDDSTALIIHAERDDHFTQPIGGAGARVACAVIE